METLRIGGVPEHFNMPWQLLLQSPKLSKKGISASWTDFSAGTGAMIEALNNDEIDIAMLLTEGAVKGIDNGGRYKIVSFYVDSPLIWGIHIPESSPYRDIDEIQGKTYAISRYG
ncbi:MAG: ABC transporter substrate-binding protein, partial [Leptolyngbya sp. SIO1D8]|nr:ABC transporter substrate-binding protein [Leptolyngbya sp. SIO1D8]